jgi:hypothetical protein
MGNELISHLITGTDGDLRVIKNPQEVGEVIACDIAYYHRVRLRTRRVFTWRTHCREKRLEVHRVSGEETSVHPKEGVFDLATK